MAARQPYLHAARHRDHRRRAAFARIVIIARTSEPSVAPVIRTREPFANSTSIVPQAAIPFGAPFNGDARRRGARRSRAGEQGGGRRRPLLLYRTTVLAPNGALSGSVIRSEGAQIGS